MANNNSSNSSNQINVPDNELGITLNQGYNGNISAKDAGHIGGNMVKKMIEAQERQMSGSAR